MLGFVLGVLDLFVGGAAPLQNYATISAGHTTPDGKLLLAVRTASLGHRVVSLQNLYVRPLAVDFYRVSPGGCSGANLQLRRDETATICYVSDPVNVGPANHLIVPTPTPRAGGGRVANQPAAARTPEPFGAHASLQAYLSWHEIPRPAKPSPSPFAIPTPT